MALEYPQTLHTKTNTKCIKDLNFWVDTIKLEANIGRPLFDIHCNSIFLSLSSRIGEIKTKINKWDLIKPKSFCTTKETISKVKRQHSEWEKIIANEATDKESQNLQAAQAAQFQKNKQPNQKIGQRTK